MSLAKKLQVPAGTKVRVLNVPKGFSLDAPTTAEARAGAALVFARYRGEPEGEGAPAFVAAKADCLSWIAYPKAGPLGTDLNRDILWEIVKPHGLRPIRLVSVDDVGSAMRLRRG